MTLNLILTRGLPGSGKSTWARQVVLDHPAKYVRVNKDELRDMLHAGKYSKGNEAIVLRVRDAIVIDALKHGYNVIVDDTNFAPKHLERMNEIARELRGGGHGTQVEVTIQDFTSVSIETCIDRDLKRPRSVGEAVIRKMWREYLAPKPPVIERNPKLQDCYICDLDGTVAINDGHRGWFDWDKVLGDKPNTAVIDSLKAVKEFGGIWTTIIYVSGRDESCRQQTTQWLMVNGLPAGDLHMRPAGDTRDDRIIKEEIYRRDIEGKFNVIAIWDDRNKVVEMWRSLGLTVFQVADGNF